MRLTLRASLVAAAAAALAGVAVACGFPTDASEDAYVTVAAAPVLLRGDEAELVARVWRRGDTGDSTEIRNTEVVWYSGDPHVATVAAAGPGAGRVTGVNPGLVELRAVAAGLERAGAGVFRLRVANPLEIDSIAPDTVRYGERVTMYGIGVGSLFFAGLGSGFLVADSLSAVGDRQGAGQLAFWVPFPSRTGHIFAAGAGQLVGAPDSTVVLPWDLYEPNEAAPTAIDLDASEPFPQIPAVRFFNPALAFEDLRDFPFGYDWYRFSTADPATPYTFVLSAPGFGGAHFTQLSGGEGGGWSVGTGRFQCKGTDFRVQQSPSDSVIIALRRLPSGSVDFAAAYGQEGQYLLAVVRTYVTAHPLIEADRYEENDLCDFADANFADPARRIDLSAPFADTLTIDNGHEIDWLRFRVPGPLPQPVTVRSRARPLGAGDRSDIDLYLLAVPTATRGLDQLAADTARGSAGALTLTLDPGDYYLAVADSAGVATRYGVCIAVGATCSFLPEPPAAPSAAIAPAAVRGAASADVALGALLRLARPRRGDALPDARRPRR
ncbi:MAG TPA: hypothetical protein VNA89_05130 [Gemmatimonadaceae bacterium]|nr:hypothetical protein [Gemmatimonadaceae bacterium]